MVVICPKCKTKLKVDEKRLLPQGSRFKCPRCASVLVIKKPPRRVKKELDRKKILVAHSNPAIIEELKSVLSDKGYTVIASNNGIDAMVKALQEQPFIAIIEVVLPKIFGFEVCKRLKSRAETKDIKVMLITSPYDKTKYRREPSSLYGADDYIDDHNLTHEIDEKINKLLGPGREEAEKPAQPPFRAPEPPLPSAEKPVEETPEPSFTEIKPPPEQAPPDEGIERARRLSRTIINDIYLYNKAKLEESLRNDSFYSVFATELNEGRKLYETRIPQEIRDRGDFFNETIGKFITDKKEKL